ncbi:hypothetical protein [Henriciella marina]|uniref:hypothetical protein n=1 Tax=Henriciella marina TaxID=453851 RepID=UPI000375B691|nr:hypothetical protein [Henriciella marina]
MDPVTTIVLCLVFILLIAVINAAVAAGRSGTGKTDGGADKTAPAKVSDQRGPPPQEKPRTRPAQSGAEPSLSHPLMATSADVWIEPDGKDPVAARSQQTEMPRGRVGLVTFVQYTEFMVIRRRP